MAGFFVGRSPFGSTSPVARDVLKALAAAGVLVSVVAPCAVMANGVGENGAWQFETTQDRVNRSAILDQIEKKKAGYYDAMKPVYTYNTYIDKQYNCSVSAATTGNTGTNSTTARTASNDATSTGQTTADTAANAATNGLAQMGLNGVVTTGAAGATPSGSVGNTQSNTGGLTSGVSGSNTSVTGSPINSGGGTTDQALNSTQANSGALTASIAGSTACVGPLNAN